MTTLVDVVLRWGMQVHSNDTRILNAVKSFIVTTTEGDNRYIWTKNSRMTPYYTVTSLIVEVVAVGVDLVAKNKGIIILIDAFRRF
jgi:hypothetical protein